MTFDPGIQYRCTIIRGKSKNEMDDLLSIYAKAVTLICPIAIERFPEEFAVRLGRALPMSKNKTLNNHRTEIVGKLFGMFYVADGKVYSSERTDRLLSDGDQPAFFKDWCFKLEYPNGMGKLHVLRDLIRNEIKFRPCCFILQLIKFFNDKKVLGPTIDEIGYYVLNALQVLQGKVRPAEVYEAILRDRNSRIAREVYVEGKKSSFSKQHIRELVGYMELSNLITVNSDQRLQINPSEREAIAQFLKEDYSKLIFNAYQYDLEDQNEKKQFWSDWAFYLGKVAFRSKSVFESNLEGLDLLPRLTGPDLESESGGLIGDKGEKVVYQYERERIGTHFPRLQNRIKIVGQTRGLGFDVHSVSGEGETPENAIHIEVKSTKRVTVPAIIDDWVSLTRNEFLAASQYLSSFWVYRVYFTNSGTFIYRIKDPFSASKTVGSQVSIEALQYRMDFSGRKEQLEQFEISGG